MTISLWSAPDYVTGNSIPHFPKRPTCAVQIPRHDQRYPFYLFICVVPFLDLIGRPAMIRHVFAETQPQQPHIFINYQLCSLSAFIWIVSLRLRIIVTIWWPIEVTVPAYLRPSRRLRLGKTDEFQHHISIRSIYTHYPSTRQQTPDVWNRWYQLQSTPLAPYENLHHGPGHSKSLQPHPSTRQQTPHLWNRWYYN